MSSGIYKIANQVTGDFYIGSAIDLSSRKYNHWLSLKKQKHHNLYLQRAFNKYGKDFFKFEIIEHVKDKKELINNAKKDYDKLVDESPILPQDIIVCLQDDCNSSPTV